MVSTPTSAFMTLPVLVIGPDPTGQLNPFAECDLPSPAKWYLPPDLTARLSDNADTEDEINDVLIRLNERSRAEHQLEPPPSKAAFYWSLTNPQTRFRSYEFIGESRVVPSHPGPLCTSAPQRRRADLGFPLHSEVAPLQAKEQRYCSLGSRTPTEACRPQRWERAFRRLDDARISRRTS